MAILTATNNGNLTVSVSVAGGTPGAAVQFAATKLNILDSVQAWTILGGVTLNGGGNGGLTTGLAAGLYVFSAISAAGFVGNSARTNITDGTGSTATRIRRAVADRILSLALPLAKVDEQWAHDESNLEFPCVVLSPGEGMPETEENGLSLTDDVGYPVLVELFDRQDVLDHSKLPDYEDWRQRMMKAFRNQPLDEVQESIICRVEYGPIVEANLPKYQFLLSRFVIRAVAREFRN